MAADCVTDKAHKPPAAGCECGIYGVEDVRSLVNLARSAEFRREYALKHQADSVAPAIRVMIVRGTLSHAVPSNKRGGGVLIPVYSNGKIYPFVRPPGVTIAGLGVHGDPPGTWRGHRFTMTGSAVVNTDPDDDLDQLSKALAGLQVHSLPTGPDGDGRLSSVLRQYAKSGRTDNDWWAEPDRPWLGCWVVSGCDDR